MDESLQLIKPGIHLPMGRISPEHETMGEPLNRLSFHDIYHAVEEEGIRYFPRLNGAGDVEIYIIYDDIESFGEQAEAQVYLDFSRHASRWIAVLWAVTDPDNPLGYPLQFDTKDETMRYLAVRFLEQESIWIHHLALDNSGLIHVYSEAISFPDDEKEEAKSLLLAAYEHRVDELEEEEIPERVLSGSAIHMERLAEEGISFYFDYDAMKNRLGEGGARESVMSSVYRAIWMMRRHPNPEARQAQMLIWVGEKNGKNRGGEDTNLLVVTMSPPLLDVYKIINLSEIEENPLATLFMSITEYQWLEEEHPILSGYFPIIGYEKGELLHIEWDEDSAQKLAAVFKANRPDEGNNPYMNDVSL
ncbi:hypothetical protein [Aneurinibacillus tyrosinisolvens]|uniref:hypothetical protein n=1 Tax=Aneurinibacillus tyrosinisolvens TaxID=1443435 RepID=UPI00063F9D95|nr:hypothetical protein [Aneurinibacillus tyrosinisolvens]